MGVTVGMGEDEIVQFEKRTGVVQIFFPFGGFENSGMQIGFTFGQYFEGISKGISFYKSNPDPCFFGP